MDILKCSGTSNTRSWFSCTQLWTAMLRTDGLPTCAWALAWAAAASACAASMGACMLFESLLEPSAVVVVLLLLAPVLLEEAELLLVAASEVEAGPGLALLADVLRVAEPRLLPLVDGPFFAPSLQPQCIKA